MVETSAVDGGWQIPDVKREIVETFKNIAPKQGSASDSKAEVVTSSAGAGGNQSTSAGAPTVQESGAKQDKKDGCCTIA